ncbi:MAG TPA: hypothetical protein VK181_12545 [Rhizobium sp.]|nr:hypothetical protein [Rhizobium sp.]
MCSDKTLTERLTDMLYGADLMGDPDISLMRKREPTFSNPKVVFVSPTGRVPSEPEMQRLGVRHIAHVDFETCSTADFADIEARMLAMTGIDDVIRKDLAGSVEREMAKAIWGEGRIPQRYAPLPEKGNRHERRAKAAKHRRSKPWK